MTEEEKEAAEQRIWERKMKRREQEEDWKIEREAKRNMARKESKMSILQNSAALFTGGGSGLGASMSATGRWVKDVSLHSFYFPWLKIYNTNSHFHTSHFRLLLVEGNLQLLLSLRVPLPITLHTTVTELLPITAPIPITLNTTITELLLITTFMPASAPLQTIMHFLPR